MDEHQIRSYFSGNWLFQLYSQKRIPYPVVAIGLPLLIVAVGAAVSALLGVFPLFAGNYLAYGGPLGIAVAFSAFGWFAFTFPRVMERLAPSFEVSQEQFSQAIRQWTDRLANRLWVLILFSIPIAAFSLADLLRLWQSPDLAWAGTPWVQSSQALFFALYFGFYNVLVVGFLLGSGAAGIVVTMLIVYSVLSLPLKLDYYRRLQAVGDLSGGLSLWALAAFIGIAIEKFLLKPISTVDLALSTAVLSILASLALLSALFAPILMARAALKRAKTRKLAIYESRLHEISQTLDQLVSSGDPAKSRKTEMARLEELLKEQEELKQQAKEVESVPNWPLNWLSGAQILVGALTPFLSYVVDYLKAQLISFLPK